MRLNCKIIGLCISLSLIPPKIIAAQKEHKQKPAVVFDEKLAEEASDKLISCLFRWPLYKNERYNVLTPSDIKGTLSRCGVYAVSYGSPYGASKYHAYRRNNMIIIEGRFSGFRHYPTPCDTWNKLVDQIINHKDREEFRDDRRYFVKNYKIKKEIPEPITCFGCLSATSFVDREMNGEISFPISDSESKYLDYYTGIAKIELILKKSDFDWQKDAHYARVKKKFNKWNPYDRSENESEHEEQMHILWQMEALS